MRKIILPLLIFVGFLVSPFKSKAQNANVQDSLVLVALYDSTSGFAWNNHTNWLAGPVKSWNGIGLDSTGRVTVIILSYNGLYGNLPTSLGSLAKLYYLDLDNNQLYGSIPEQFGNLTNLQNLYLYGNQLIGNIPLQLGNLFNLQSLLLYSNQLTGSIPASLGNLTNLQRLILADNQLDGNIPASLGNLTKVTLLELNNNQLSGSIPSSLGNLINLQNLLLEYNQLSDTIPSSLCNLINVEILYLNNNQLSGNIPSSLGKLAQLERLYLNNNQLTGPIPSSMSNNANLIWVWLNNNQLSGSIPPSLGTNANLQVLYLNSNHLSGTIPSSLDSLANLQYLSVNQNYFTFDGMEKIAQQYSFGIYTPQDTVLPLHLNNHTLSVSAGGNLSNNTYKWYKYDDTLVATITGDSTYTPITSGGYWVEVTNALAPKLTLFSDTFTILTPPSPQVIDSLALVALYDSTNGPNWLTHSNWITGPVKNWYGITLNSSGRVASVNLNSNNLKGNIPAQLSELTQLKYLNLGSNYLTFNGLESVAQQDTFAIYTPQHDMVLQFNTGALSVSAGGTLSNNTYKWYKGDTLIATSIGDSSFTPTLSGNYWVTVANNIATKLILRSDTLLVNASPNITDSLALVALYNSTNGPNWATNTGWLAGPLKNWYGIQLDSTGRVISINLNNRNLNGRLPAEIGNLTNLQYLYLFNNALMGSIPMQLGGLTKLNILSLQNNYLSGSIPSSLGNLTNLTQLLLQSNQLSGTIPSSLGNLTNLNWMWLENNQLSDSIPSSLGNLSNLSDFELDNNQLSGSIPPSLGNLKSLNYLDLAYNHLSGSIPSSLGNLPNIIKLYLNNNQLRDSIPSSIASLQNLQYLFVYNNYFNYSDLYPIELMPGYVYAPEYHIPIHYNSGKLSVSAGGVVEYSTYSWYKGDTLVATITGDSTYTPISGGRYSVAVNNEIFYQLTLYSDTIVTGGTDSLILPAKEATEYASYEYTDTAGWTHYYWDNNTPNNLSDDTLLLSLKKNGQNIGTIGDGTFAVKLVATAGAGSNAGVEITNPLITNTSGYWVMNRYWQVTPTQEPTSDVGVRFYYNNQDVKDINGSFPAHNLTNRNLIFYKAVGGNPDPTANLAGATKIISITPDSYGSDSTWTYHVLSDTTQYAEYSVAGFSGGGGGGTGNGQGLLPVTLINFAATPGKGGDVLLNWQTAQEINSGYYTIERSVTATSFTALGNVTAAGNSTNVQSYKFTDYTAAQLNTGVVYYRLLIVDKNGDKTYSKTIKVYLSATGNNTLQVYPNPVQNTLTLVFNAAATGKYTILVTNAAGKVVKSAAGTSAAGYNKTETDVNNLAAGIYIVTVEGNGIKQSITVVKQ